MHGGILEHGNTIMYGQCCWILVYLTPVQHVTDHEHFKDQGKVQARVVLLNSCSCHAPLSTCEINKSSTFSWPQAYEETKQKVKGSNKDTSPRALLGQKLTHAERQITRRVVCMCSTPC